MRFFSKKVVFVGLKREGGAHRGASPFLFLVSIPSNVQVFCRIVSCCLSYFLK